MYPNLVIKVCVDCGLALALSTSKHSCSQCGCTDFEEEYSDVYRDRITGGLDDDVTIPMGDA